MLLKKEAHRIAVEVLRPCARELDRMPPEQRILPGSPYFQAIGQLKSLGYHRMFLPAPYSDSDTQVSALGRAIFLEELGWGSLGLATAFGVDMLPFVLIAMFGSDELKEEVLLPWVEDTEGKYHGCWGATEPDHGSDGIMSLRDESGLTFGKAQVSIQSSGDDWIINGQKSAWVSSAPIATHCALHVQLAGEENPLHGMFVIVDLSSEGVTLGQPIQMLGARDDPQGEIFFENVRIPGKNVLVANSPFYGVFIDQLLCATSSNIANIAVGVARAAFEEALEYTRRRVQGGQPIVNHKNVQLTLYSMFEKIETARCFARQALAFLQGETPKLDDLSQDEPQSPMGLSNFLSSPRHARCAQIYAKRIAFEVANDALQLSGAFGLSDESLFEKLFRDARSLWIEDGTLEVLSLDAARDLIKNYETDQYVPTEVIQRW